MRNKRSPLFLWRTRGIFVLLVCLSGLTDALLTPNFLSSVVQSTIRASGAQDLMLPPPGDKISLPKHMHTSLVLLPGALVKPEQYREVARAIQQESQQAVWVSIPAVQPIANPHTIGVCVRDAFRRLKRFGYPGSKTFVGGHSLGGAFLPSIFDQDQMHVNQVEGLIHLGCILSRKSKDDSRIDKVPHMVLAGDLDGLVRVSRVAEDYHRYAILKHGESDPDILQHSVVLVPGMNHFGFVSGKAPFMDEFRDLEGELSHQDSVQQVASSVSVFMDYHRTGDRERVSPLLDKIEQTRNYLKPLLAAMKLEGSYHLDKVPCHLCEENEDGENCSCDDCIKGSPWAAMVQRELAPEGISYGEVNDEFRQSWWINPLHDPPFYHPKITASSNDGAPTYSNSTLDMGALVSTNLGKIIHMETVSEPVYEKPDLYLFDAGFFSNAALELRCKFNSRQAILNAVGVDVPHKNECGTCSKMNERTIEWALEQVPESVRRRYLERGVQLIAGKDIEHSAGPSWIWSYLNFRRVDDRTVELNSHIMSTPLDHPVPASGGKLYCKLLSPAKALDWIYTDSLRPATESSKFYHEVLLSPTNFLKFTAETSQKGIREITDPFFIPKRLVRAGLGGLALAAELNRKVR